MTLPSLGLFTGNNMQLFWTFLHWALAQVAPGMMMVAAVYTVYLVIRMIVRFFTGYSETDDIDYFSYEEDEEE